MASEEKVKSTFVGRWLREYSGVLSAIATVVIAYVYFSQTAIMQSTMEVLQQQQRFDQKPILKVHLHQDLKRGSMAAYEETEEGGERWQLPYYVTNISGNTAWGMRYWHKISSDSTLRPKDVGELETTIADELIFPSDSYFCGIDELLRQTWIDSAKQGSSMYRHFVLTYRDETDNVYTYHAVWRIDYTQGEPLDFRSISYSPIEL